MKFAASWNHTTKFSTACAMLTLVILPSLLAHWEVPYELITITLVIAVLIGVFSWGLGPSGYVVEDDELQILRPIQKVRYRYDDIRQVKQLSRADMGVPLRVSGNGGLFGFYGRYYSRKLGWHHWYATRSVDLVGVETVTDGWVLVSPDDREGFVTAVSQRIAKNGLAALASAVSQSSGELDYDRDLAGEAAAEPRLREPQIVTNDVDRDAERIG